MKKVLTIAIDGPSGSGKSSVAREVSKRLGILHMNSGSLYRAIGLKAYRMGYSPNDAYQIKNCLDRTDLRIDYIDGVQHTIIDGEDITNILKSKITDVYSAAISDCIEIREYILGIQQKVAKSIDLVMEGRDITSVVLPNASYKFFVTASLDTRAKRRFVDYQKTNKEISFEEVRQGLKERDWNDEHREHSPLIQTKDAILIETDNETLDETVTRMLSYIKR